MHLPSHVQANACIKSNLFILIATAKYFLLELAFQSNGKYWKKLDVRQAFVNETTQFNILIYFQFENERI